MVEPQLENGIAEESGNISWAHRLQCTRLLTCSRVHDLLSCMAVLPLTCVYSVALRATEAARSSRHEL